MNENRTLAWLTTVPTSDNNFKTQLAQPSAEQVREALACVRGKPGHHYSEAPHARAKARSHRSHAVFPVLSDWRSL